MLVTEGATTGSKFARSLLAAPAALYPTDTATMGGNGDTGNTLTCAMVNGHAIQHLDHFLSCFFLGISLAWGSDIGAKQIGTNWTGFITIL